MTNFELEKAVKIDLELTRLASALKLWQPFRAWAYAFALAGRRGWVEPRPLYKALQVAGVVNSWRAYNRLLNAGLGVFWRLGYGLDAQGVESRRFYLVGYVKLCAALTQIADDQPDLTETNEPPGPKAYVDLSGAPDESQARAYAAWLEHIVGPNPISRLALCALWNKQAKTLLRYERLTNTLVRRHFAEGPDPKNELNPAHAYLCRDADGSHYVSWQMPNSYHPTTETPRARPGNASRARRARKARRAGRASDADKPPSPARFDPPVSPATKRRGLERTGRLYFADRHTRRGRIEAAKSLNNHLRKHGDVFQRRHYLRLSGAILRAGRTVLWQQSTGGRYNLRRDWRGESTAQFATLRGLYASMGAGARGSNIRA